MDEFSIYLQRDPDDVEGEWIATCEDLSDTAFGETPYAALCRLMNQLVLRMENIEAAQDVVMIDRDELEALEIFFGDGDEMEDGDDE